jgi:oligopeptide transport system substrate-binding protein
MRFSRTSKALGMMAIAALALTGCGGGGANSGSTNAAGNSSKVILADGSEPQRTLIKSDTNEVHRGKVINQIIAGKIT